MLKAGGEMLLSTPNISSLMNVYKILNQQHPFIFYEHVSEFTSQEVKDLLESHQFELLLVETHDAWDESIERTTKKRLKSL